jgi:hypothetical protein
MLLLVVLPLLLLVLLPLLPRRILNPVCFILVSNKRNNTNKENI